MGRVHQISVSPGGVPKLPIAAALVRVEGIEGDGHNDRKHHGGPNAAVCLFALEVIERLRSEGHPIGIGTTGENLTIQGLDWPSARPGCQLVFEGGVELEVTRYTTPCATIRDSFSELQFNRIKQDLHPGESRVYARVLREGTIRLGESVRLVGQGNCPAPDPVPSPRQ
jgi:MOSC domain-containing protein YiiM